MAVRVRHCVFSVNSWQEIWESSGDEELSLGNLRNAPVHRWGHLTVHLWKWTVGVNPSWLSTSSCPAPPQHGAQVLHPKHLPEGGWWCLLRKSSRNRPDFGKQASSRGSQTWRTGQSPGSFWKTQMPGPNPGDFPLIGLGGDQDRYFKKAPQVILMCNQSENLVVNELDRMFLSCSDGRGWELAPLEAPGPTQCLKAPAGLFLQDKSRHLNCEGPGSKYVRFHGPSGVCCSYLNSAAEVEKQPQIMCKWMSTAVFQRNFIYGTEIRISCNFLVWVFFPAI